MKLKIPFSAILFFLFLPLAIQGQVFENFENGEKTFYGESTVSLSTGTWLLSDALLGTSGGDKKNGNQSTRIRDGFIQMNFDAPNGMSEISFYAANFSNDTGGVLQVNYSTNGGSTWQQLGETISVTSTLTQYTITENISGDIRFQFKKTSGTRINVDDVLITDYVDITEEPTINLLVNDVEFQHNGTYDFGTTTGSSSANLRIRNTGEEDLVISEADISGAQFSVNESMEVTIGSFESKNFTIAFQSQESGQFTGSINLTTNDPDNESFTLNLQAETLDTNAPIPIAEARNLPAGTLVTVTGHVTVASQFAGPVYFQDETGGIGWYSDAIMREQYTVGAIIGDSLVVTGEIGDFNNLLQIVNHTEFEVFPESNIEVEPVDITIADLNSGNFEGQLVRISDLEFQSSGLFSGGANYDVIDATGSGQLRVDNFTNIGGLNIPNSPAEVVGVAGRFLNTHQILPRMRSDIQVLVGPVIVTPAPYETSATSNSITFEWETQSPGHSEIRYGTTTSLEMGMVVDESPKTEHNITLTGLDPATVYKVQLRSAVDQDTSSTSVYITTTSSPAGSTGEILTFFNKSVAHELATYQEASENVNFSNQLISRIDAAEESADFAFYSLSGDIGNTVADAIIAAHNRGVAVRVIQSGHTGNANPIVNRMSSAGVLAVQSLGMEQMHNKFAVIDAHHSDPSKSWLVTSSWNATDQGTFQQFQNMINIQDVALTRAYWREFNQMWGADSGNFNSSNARFSEDKVVVNPSAFWIGEDETHIQLYFSPQGNTESQINRALTSAQQTIDLGLNIFTRRSISNTMLSRLNDGVKVRGVMGQITGQGNEWDYISSWADVHHFSQAQFGLLHHKYGIIDGEATTENSKVITGSHNWSANANFFNDENTLIIQSERVANEFFQEYAARYWQAGGEDQFNVSVSTEPDAEIPGVVTLSQNYPNPFNPSTKINFELPQQQEVTIQLYDITGRMVGTLLDNQSMSSGSHTVSFDAAHLASGIYLYRLQTSNGQILTRKMTLIK